MICVTGWGCSLWQEFPLACAFITRYPRSAEYLSFVESETREIVRQVRNHPSVMLWCGGNEFDPKVNSPGHRGDAPRCAG